MLLVRIWKGRQTGKEEEEAQFPSLMVFRMQFPQSRAHLHWRKEQRQEGISDLLPPSSEAGHDVFRPSSTPHKTLMVEASTLH